ncbi:RimJ/RimL family protein N-acetyltransferase [Murinocardiopsis flavida]|uniref:RimJ/RimL family protein N-acetyltransferase n=1 Tax=Murinocardiopsis flavida TaxID=645275 RepID=A0A2P8DQF4_9ACTN|nr:GNAT family protein [Murinocardiopsis flavida]PSK99428.1 RimJ/RimL family protein N-acetyltransferase [Murinocardiopsis flavida]
MTPPDAFRDQPELHGTAIRLEPMAERHFAGLWPLFADEDVRRLTGTHQRFTEDEVRRFTATRRDLHDRADWTVVRAADGAVLGDAAVNDFDHHNASAGFRIALAGPALGRGHGTEALRLVVDHVFDTVGLHRLELEVYAFNPRARRCYEKAGFTAEGVRRDALYWDGAWHDAVTMAVLAGDPRPWREHQ